MSDNKLNESVIMPREDFLELSEAAWNQPTPTLGERAATTVQTTLVFAGMAAAVTAGTYGWAKAIDWLEMRRAARKSALNETPLRSAK